MTEITLKPLPEPYGYAHDGMPDGRLGFVRGKLSGGHGLVCSTMLLYTLAQVEQIRRDAVRDALKSELSRLHRNYRTHVETISRWTFAMQAALIEGRTNSAESGLRWIANTLAGPGLLPSSLANDDQAWFEDKLAEYEEWAKLHPVPHQYETPAENLTPATGAAA